MPEMNRDARELVRDLQRAGWRVRQGKHLKLVAPGTGKSVSISRSPSDRRALQNILSDCRKALR